MNEAEPDTVTTPVSDTGTISQPSTGPILPPIEEPPKLSKYHNPEEAARNNMTLQQAYKEFIHKQVRIKSTGQVGKVIGVDPRPERGGPDGTFLCIAVPRNALPGRVPTEHTHALIDDVEVVS